jgi:transcriptional regulator GlxA family with amidase domain
MSSTKKIGIIVFDGVLTSEIIAPAEVFGIAVEQDWFNEWSVELINAENKNMITTQEGIQIGADTQMGIDDWYDVLIVSGAYDMDSLIANDKLDAFIKKHEEADAWLSSNCSGAFLLANSGVLDGKQATTWFGGEESLQEQHPQIQVQFDAPVVVDTRRVTSNGSVVSYQSAIVLLGKLSSPDHAKEVYDTLAMSRLDDWATIQQSIAETVNA